MGIPSRKLWTMAKKDPTVELLKSVDIFSGLNNTEILSIAKLADTLKHTAGKVVVRKGDPSDDLQIIESGLYEVYLWDELFKIERPLGVMKSGEIFGEMGVITGEPRSAFIRCRKAGSSVRLKKDDFIKYLENNPKVAIGIARTLVHRLNASNSSRRIPFENISRFEITRDIIGLLPLQVILRHRILPLKKEDLVVTVGMVDPSDLVGRNVASEFLNKFETEWVGISQPEFESFRNNRLHDLLEQTIADGDDEPPTLLWLAGNTAAASDLSNPVSAALNGILEQAIEASASDLSTDEFVEYKKDYLLIDRFVFVEDAY